jgi:hypothetical protein
MGGRALISLASSFLCIFCAEAKAQQRTFVTGDEVRVTAPSLFPGRVRGTVLGARPDTLVLELEFQKEAGHAVIPSMRSRRSKSRVETRSWLGHLQAFCSASRAGPLPGTR